MPDARRKPVASLLKRDRWSRSRILIALALAGLLAALAAYWSVLLTSHREQQREVEAQTWLRVGQMAQSASVRLGEKLLVRAMRAEGFADIPTPDHPAWTALLHLTGNRDRDELFTDIGMGKRIANLVAKRLVESLTTR